MNDTLMIPKRYDSVSGMGRKKKPLDADDNGMNRTIRMDKGIWALLDQDSERCGRSSNKQIEAILRVYFRDEDVELKDVDEARSTVSPHMKRVAGSRVADIDTAFNNESKTIRKKKTA